MSITIPYLNLTINIPKIPEYSNVHIDTTAILNDLLKFAPEPMKNFILFSVQAPVFKYFIWFLVAVVISRYASSMDRKITGWFLNKYKPKMSEIKKCGIKETAGSFSFWLSFWGISMFIFWIEFKKAGY
jgi:hypothetical protein